MFLYDHTSIEALNPVAVSIGNLSIRWYAIFIMTGAIVALFIAIRWAKRLGIKEDDMYTAFTLGIVFGILGARIYYCLFYNFHEFITAPWIVFTQFRNGGLAIHGGIIAGIVFAVIFCKKKHINLLAMLEIVMPGFLIGQIFGRWGNFFNQEAHGGIVPGVTLDAQREWLSNFLPNFIVNQMYIYDVNSAGSYVWAYWQPTFLYESVLNLIGLAIILILRKWWKKYYVGDSLCIYLVWYGIVRYFIEVMRTDALMMGSLKVAQVISILMVVAGLALFILRHVFKYKPILWTTPFAEGSLTPLPPEEDKKASKNKK
ncbi:MAG: prolipoprotein diacylglyceryl transferase [Bacilli bacterium]